MTFIDPTAKRTVDILDLHAGSQDTVTGLYTSGQATIQSNVVVDMQPMPRSTDKVLRSMTGEDVVADFQMFTETLLSGGIKIFHTVKDQADNVEYEIVGIDDLRDHWEFFLKRQDRDGA